MMGVVTCNTDLEYVNTKLAMNVCGHVWLKKRPNSNTGTKRAGLNRHQGRDNFVHSIGNSPSISATGSRQTTAAHHLNRRLVTPDSVVPCSDLKCPIKIPHNIGRFYLDGQRADSPCDADYETSSGIRMVPVSHYFNYTKPPAEITDAYFRLAEGNASTEDMDRLRRYKMNHSYSPIISEYPSPTTHTEPAPLACLVFDPKKHDKKHHEWLFETLEKNVDKEIGYMVEPKKVNKRVEKRAIEEEELHKPPFPSHCNRPPILPRRYQLIIMDDEANSGRAHEQGALKHWEQNSDLREMRSRHKREMLLPMPKGKRLQEVQLSIQERVINELAERAFRESRVNNLADTQSESTSSWRTVVTGSMRSSLSSTGSTAACLTARGLEDIDRKLEVHAALSKRLKTKLVDSSFQLVSLLDKDGFELETEAKFECISEVLLIVRHAFRQLLGDFTRDYRPSGIEVKDDELEILFEEHLATYELLVERYPSMRIKDIISSLVKLGKRARLENLC